MGLPALDALPDRPSRCVLVVVEDHALAELLIEALFAAGHVAQVAESREVLASEVDCAMFSTAIVDLDCRARDGAAVVGRLRSEFPTTTIIALLPCGGRASDFAAVQYHLAIEKPARLKAVLAAVAASPRVDP